MKTRIPALTLSVLATLLALPGAHAADEVTYENGIRQLVDKRCAECHGNDAPTMAEFKADMEKYKKWVSP